MAEELKNELEDMEEPTPEQLKELEEQRKQAMKWFKSQTALLKIRADYEEQKMRIATYQRDALFAEYDIVRFNQQQKAAEEAAKKASETNESESDKETNK